MITPIHRIAVASVITGLVSLPGIGMAQQKPKIAYSSGVDAGNLVIDGRKVAKSAFESGLTQQLNKVRRSAVGKDAGLNLTAINVVEDCSASVTCGNGKTIECSIQGPGTCESGMVSVVCIQGNSSTVQTCSNN